ncbi:hypothetical protein CP532_3765 [Ophiocordyceps camponoti-leonardi (nom. inval.)]|nr:hypothetical protein CP532_3765 [Ophiocordyceps camponoti-leonardi (nom. inval.)]
MAAVQSREKVVMNTDEEPTWFKKDLQEHELQQPAREVFEKYSRVPAERVLSHLKGLLPYPCIGLFWFLDFGISELPVYDEVKERIISGEKFLDLGCCFGQDMRKLIADGVPQSNIYGSDLDMRFIDLGYEVFRDRHSLRSKFIQADILDDDSDLNQLKGQLGIISAQSLFHLFPWNRHVEIAKRIISLFNPTGSALLLGRTIGNKDNVMGGIPGMECYMHTAASWRQLWVDVGKETGTCWDVSVTELPSDPGMSQLVGHDAHMLWFVIRRIG